MSTVGRYVVSSPGAAYRTMACDSCANVAARAEEMRIVKYAELTGDYTFCPAAFESLSGEGLETSQFIRSFGKRLSEHTPDIR